jgi:hypothetical protein
MYQMNASFGLVRFALPLRWRNCRLIGIISYYVCARTRTPHAKIEFPERPDALRKFLSSLRNMGWNISLFHYRNHGAGAQRSLSPRPGDSDPDNGLSIQTLARFWPASRHPKKIRRSSASSCASWDTRTSKRRKMLSINDISASDF